MSSKALNYSLWLIGKRDYTVFEIERKLKLKEYPADDAAVALKYLIEHDLINDRHFAKRYVENHPTRGQIRLKWELIKKGIDKELVDETIANINLEDEMIVVKELAGEWLKKHQNRPKEKIYQSLGGYLARQGFGFDVVKSVLNDVLK